MLYIKLDDDKKKIIIFTFKKKMFRKNILENNFNKSITIECKKLNKKNSRNHVF